MKLMVTVLVLLCASLTSAHAEPVVEKKDWRQTFVVGDAPTLKIDNIWGDINIVTGDSGRITMSFSTERRAANQEDFELSKTLIPLHIDNQGNDVIVRVGRNDRQWSREQRCDRCRLHVDLMVVVPPRTRLDVSTINDGDIQVSGVSGIVSAQNINGAVSTSGLRQCDKIEALNGDINAQFSQEPALDCLIETLNGDIRLSLPDGVSVDFAVETGNGKIRSDLDLSSRDMPAKVERQHSNGRYQYDIEQLAGLRVGSGGNTLTIKSLNGDIRLTRSTDK
ncbi:MAG: hypothetical protein AAF004_03120 [Pseudomonadota bacterium]